MSSVIGAGLVIRAVNRVKASVNLTLLLMLASGCFHLEPAHSGLAMIVFERQEDNGFVNIVPCNLVLSDHQKVTLSGGSRAVVSVSPGQFYVRAFSIDPYTPNFDETAWRSHRVGFNVADGDMLRVSVEPRSAGSTYIGGWALYAVNYRMQ